MIKEHLLRFDTGCHALVDLFMRRATAKRKPRDSMRHGVVEATDRMHQARLAGAHGIHLTDAARLVSARHQEQVACTEYRTREFLGESTLDHESSVRSGVLCQCRFDVRITTAENQNEAVVR